MCIYCGEKEKRIVKLFVFCKEEITYCNLTECKEKAFSEQFLVENSRCEAVFHIFHTVFHIEQMIFTIQLVNVEKFYSCYFHVYRQ